MDQVTDKKIKALKELKELQVEIARNAVNDQIIPAYLNYRYQQISLFSQKKIIFDSKIKGTVDIVNRSLKGKTKPALLKTLSTLLENSSKFLDSVYSIYINSSFFVGPENRIGNDSIDIPFSSKGTIQIKDSLLNSKNPLDIAIGILNELRILNEKLHDELTSSFKEKIFLISFNLSELSSLEVKEIAVEENLYPDDNIKLDQVANVTTFIDKTSKDIEKIIRNIQKVYNNMSDTDKLNSGLFAYSMTLLSSKKKKKKSPNVYDENGQYGGDQGSAVVAYDKGNGDAKIGEIVRQYYPNMTDDEVDKYLQKLENEGCAYVSYINSFLDSYTGTPEEFEAIFGFPLYNESGAINYNYLIVDFYASQDNHNPEGGIFGFGEQDEIDKSEDSSATKGAGMTNESGKYRFERYMKDHGVDVDVKNNEGFLGLSDIEANQKNYNQYHGQGDIIISVWPVILEDVDGNELPEIDGVVTQ